MSELFISKVIRSPVNSGVRLLFYRILLLRITFGTNSLLEREHVLADTFYWREIEPMMTKRIVQLGVLLMIICASSAYVPGQQTSAPSSKKLNKIVFDGDMASLLSHLAANHNVNIGFETDPLVRRPSVKIDVWFNTLEDVLDAIVQAEPKYQWRNLNGFIDVYPREASCPLLDTVINGLQVNNIDWAGASQALTNLPEVQSQLEAIRLERRDLTNLLQGADVNLFSLTLENVTLRQALHEITKKSRNSFWMFQRHGGAKGRLFSIRNVA
jgi:hypothetical protein